MDIVTFTCTLVLTLSMIGLIVDGGRWMVARSDIHFATQASATAAARQLDGMNGAIARATSAASAIAARNVAGLNNGFTAFTVSPPVFYCGAAICSNDAATMVSVSGAVDVTPLFLGPRMSSSATSFD
jgi:hypothetical protein